VTFQRIAVSQRSRAALYTHDGARGDCDHGGGPSTLVGRRSPSRQSRPSRQRASVLRGGPSRIARPRALTTAGPGGRRAGARREDRRDRCRSVGSRGCGLPRRAKGERAASRDRLRRDRIHSLDATRAFLVAGLDHLETKKGCPIPPPMATSMSDCLGDVNLFERWLRLTIEIRPSRGQLTDHQAELVRTLKTETVDEVRQQFTRIQTGRQPRPADFDSATVYGLRLDLARTVDRDTTRRRGQPP
jgi:hypothetical protein